MKNNKVLSWILILASLFIIILFTKNVFFNLQASFDEKNLKIQEKQTEKETLDRLEQINEKLKSWTWDTEVLKYLNGLKEDEIVDYIYSMAEEGHLGTIKNLSISKWKENELWFLESDISLTMDVDSEEKMQDVLDFFVKNDSKYKFFINTFSYQKPVETLMTKNISSFEITIPLKLFYK